MPGEVQPEEFANDLFNPPGLRSVYFQDGTAVYVFWPAAARSASLALAQHLANAQAQATARGLSREATSRVLTDAKDYWESRLNTY